MMKQGQALLRAGQGSCIRCACEPNLLLLTSRCALPCFNHTHPPSRIFRSIHPPSMLIAGGVDVGKDHRLPQIDVGDSYHLFPQLASRVDVQRSTLSMIVNNWPRDGPGS